MGGLHDVQMPAGPQAAVLFELWIAMLVVCVVVFLAVMAALAAGIWRTSPVTDKKASDLASHPRTESSLRRVVGCRVDGLGVIVSAREQALVEEQDVLHQVARHPPRLLR